MTQTPATGLNLRRFFAIDEREKVVALAQTTLGKLALFATVLIFVLLPPVVKRLHTPASIILLVAVAAIHAFLPKYRAPVLFTATWLVAFSNLPVSAYSYASLLVLMVFGWCSLSFVRRHKNHIYARRPAATLLIAIGLSVFGASLLPEGIARELAWAFLMLCSGYIWFLSYAIVDQRSRHRSADLVQMGVMHPFWVATNNPAGKGATYLRKYLATNAHDLAVTQLKGLKLMIWAIVLLGIQMMLYWVFIQKLKLPTQQQAMEAFFKHEPYPILVGWLAITLELVSFTLYFAVFGHKLIAIARLAGVRLPRNICRPLESRTLAEFWNRYNFYFKEVMVDFFYVPTFLRTFQKYQRVRMFFATFMAAGVGNLLFHLMRDIPEMKAHGIWATFESYTSYMFYCVMLAIGIGISQLRLHAGIKPSPTALGRLWSFFVIWFFIVCLHTFDPWTHTYTFREHFAFLASLFGIN